MTGKDDCFKNFHFCHNIAVFQKNIAVWWCYLTLIPQILLIKTSYHVLEYQTFIYGLKERNIGFQYMNLINL